MDDAYYTDNNNIVGDKEIPVELDEATLVVEDTYRSTTWTTGRR